MGFLSRFFQRSNRAAPAKAEQQKEQGEEIAAELKTALDAMQANDFHAAVVQALPFVHHQTPSIMADANRICAISYARLNDYAKAFELYLHLFEVEEGAHTALQLATTSVMCGEVPRGEAWLIKFDQLNAVKPEVAPAEARTNFITALTTQGHWADAFPHLNWLKEGYQSLHITDSHFLYIRGFPFLSVMLEKSYPIVSSVLSGDAVIEWYGELAQRLDEDGQAAINAFLSNTSESDRHSQ